MPDAFDVIAAITWGHDYGFMREARDVDNSIQDMKDDMDYKAAVSSLHLFFVIQLVADLTFASSV